METFPAQPERVFGSSQEGENPGTMEPNPLGKKFLLPIQKLSDAASVSKTSPCDTACFHAQLLSTTPPSPPTYTPLFISRLIEWQQSFVTAFDLCRHRRARRAHREPRRWQFSWRGGSDAISVMMRRRRVTVHGVTTSTMASTSRLTALVVELLMQVNFSPPAASQPRLSGL